MHVSECIGMYVSCMPAIAERLRPAHPALPERADVGSIPVVYRRRDVVPLSHILGRGPRTRALNWAGVIVRQRQAWAAPCSTSTLGPWSGPMMITRPVPPEKLV